VLRLHAKVSTVPLKVLEVWTVALSVKDATNVTRVVPAPGQSCLICLLRSTSNKDERFLSSLSWSESEAIMVAVYDLSDIATRISSVERMPR
jgi:hypothetical protein